MNSNDITPPPGSSQAGDSNPGSDFIERYQSSVAPSAVPDLYAWQRKSDSGSGTPSASPQEPTPVVPVSWREIFAVALGVILADATIYRGAGFAGMTALAIGCALLIWFGSAKPSFSTRSVLVFFLLALASLKLLWSGFIITAVFAFGLLFLFGLLQSGRKPKLPDIVDYFFQSTLLGGNGLTDFSRYLGGNVFRPSSAACLAVGLPILALGLFGTIFVMANRSLVDMFQRWLRDFGEWFSGVSDWLPSPIQIPLWILFAWILTGMIRPYYEPLRAQLLDFFDSMRPESEWLAANKNESTSPPVAEWSWYAGCRNMLIAVIGLFAVYLVFEFQTLWFKDFPDGFCYSDYSHNGAAWLVVALALSTVVLSLVFRREMYREPRVKTIRNLAWVWSVLNFVLVLAVYNRLWLYINFNGMTRMRVVGLLGVTAVLIGFVMVVRKIAGERPFVWLLERFTWTVLLLATVYVILPVDLLVHRYNVARILRGGRHLAPSVQLTVQPLSDEAYLVLLPIARYCDDDIIRQGVRAMLAEKFSRMQLDRLSQIPMGKFAWTRYQASEDMLLQHLEANADVFQGVFPNLHRQDQARQRFVDYVYRWY